MVGIFGGAEKGNLENCCWVQWAEKRDDGIVQLKSKENGSYINVEYREK